MALESGTYINSLNAANPVSTDGLAQADDHLRLIKSTVKATFPNLSGAVTATHTELNYVDGVTSNIQTQFDNLIPSGTKMLFQQTSAPTGWTKITTHNDKAIRVVSGTASTGGTVAFTTAFASHTPTGSVSTSISGTVANHTLTISQIPSHSHETTAHARASGSSGLVHEPQSGTSPLQFATNSVGGGGAHNHGWSGSATSTFTGTAIDLDVSYVDVIICSKD